MGCLGDGDTGDMLRKQAPHEHADRVDIVDEEYMERAEDRRESSGAVSTRYRHQAIWDCRLDWRDRTDRSSRGTADGSRRRIGVDAGPRERHCVYRSSKTSRKHYRVITDVNGGRQDAQRDFKPECRATAHPS